MHKPPTGPGAPLSLILVDADYFKALNDRYGHPEGDRCLKALASALRDHLKRPSDIVARYGGEEFAVLLPGTDAAGAQVIAEKLRAAVAGLGIPHEGHPLGHITVSLGVATLIPVPSLQTIDLIARADAALYRAKAGGRNRVEAADPSAGA